MNKTDNKKKQSFVRQSFAYVLNTNFWIPVAFATIIFFLNMDVSFASGKPNTDEAWKAFMNEYRVILASIAGIGALTSILVFIFHFIKLGSAGSSPHQRSEALGNMVVSGIITALLGGISGILSIFYHVVFDGLI